MTVLTSKPLDPKTWPDFARLVEAHSGVWGGCWCMAFHPPRGGGPHSAEGNRADKHERVLSGTAHAALVYDGEACVGWCQFGPPGELPRIKHRRAYEAASPQQPDWRITCFFVGKSHRKAGVASAALEGALGEIARLGGGTVESSPEDVTDRAVSSSFLYNATVSLFERHGFERTRRLGKNHWLVTRFVEPLSHSSARTACGRGSP
jgi:ribosomal protein S18 acetylase RimI-like enzyme